MIRILSPYQERVRQTIVILTEVTGSLDGRVHTGDREGLRCLGAQHKHSPPQGRIPFGPKAPGVYKCCWRRAAAPAQDVSLPSNHSVSPTCRRCGLGRTAHPAPGREANQHGDMGRVYPPRAMRDYRSDGAKPLVFLGNYGKPQETLADFPNLLLAWYESKP